MATQLESPSETTSINYSQLNNLGLIDEEIKHLSYQGQCNFYIITLCLWSCIFSIKLNHFSKRSYLKQIKWFRKKNFIARYFEAVSWRKNCNLQKCFICQQSWYTAGNRSIRLRWKPTWQSDLQNICAIGKIKLFGIIRSDFIFG